MEIKISMNKFNKNIQFRKELVNWKIDEKKISKVKHSKDGDEDQCIKLKKENFCSTEGKTFLTIKNL